MLVEKWTIAVPPLTSDSTVQLVGAAAGIPSGPISSSCFTSLVMDFSQNGDDRLFAGVNEQKLVGNRLARNTQLMQMDNSH